MDSELSIKFDLDPSSGFRETRVNRRQTDRRMDACVMTVDLLTKSSRAKNNGEQFDGWTDNNLGVYRTKD